MLEMIKVNSWWMGGEREIDGERTRGKKEMER